MDFIPENGKEARISQFDTPYDERLSAAGLRKSLQWNCVSAPYAYILTGSDHFDSNSFLKFETQISLVNLWEIVD
jgi:hypothetical protein